ncbi:MAG: DUF6122 family protein [Candidatus Woesearchaeota archaeon]
MPITPIHLAINYSLYFIVIFTSSLEFSFIHLIFLSLAELIDLDHLNKKQIYKKNRNSFKHHFFHKNWKITALFALILIPFYPLTFLGFGIISHLIVDFLHLKFILEKGSEPD